MCFPSIRWNRYFKGDEWGLPCYRQQRHKKILNQENSTMKSVERNMVSINISKEKGMV